MNLQHMLLCGWVKSLQSAHPEATATSIILKVSNIMDGWQRG